MLTHVVPTVHETCRLLVAWEVCVQSYFCCSIGAMNSSFENVVLASPVLKRKKREVSLCM
jgi:hypothetical protein